MNVQPLPCLEGLFSLDSYSLQPCSIALARNGSTLLPGDIVGIFVPCALGDKGREREGCVGHLVSSTCLIYCPAAFEVGQAEFASLGFLVISPPPHQDYSPGEAHHHQPQDIGSTCLS